MKNGRLKAVPCRLRLYAIKFVDGRKDHVFSAIDDKEALNFVLDILSISGKLNSERFSKRRGEAVLCIGTGRKVFPPEPKEKSKKKKK